MKKPPEGGFGVSWWPVKELNQAMVAPLAYLYCEDDKVAELLVALHQLGNVARGQKVQEFLGKLQQGK